MATNESNEPAKKSVNEIESQEDRKQPQATDLSGTGAEPQEVKTDGKDVGAEDAQATIDKFTKNKTALKNEKVARDGEARKAE